MGEPKLISRSEAARLCGLSPAGFSNWVYKGWMPKALPGTKRYDRAAVIEALDRLRGVESAPKVVVQAPALETPDDLYLICKERRHGGNRTAGRQGCQAQTR